LVPDSCTAHIDLRMCAPGSADECEKSLRETIEALRREDAQFELSEFNIYERRDPIEMAQDHSVIQTMAECIQSIRKKKPRFLGSLSAGDVYHTMKNGIPGAWVGPGDARFPTRLMSASESMRSLMQQEFIPSLFCTFVASGETIW